MNKIQRYIFLSLLRTLLIVIGGLVLLALLAQSLSRIDLIIDDRQSALTYFSIVLLSTPQLVSLLIPLALLIAMLWSLNRLQSDNAITIGHASGMSRWQIASPVLRLTMLVTLLHLAINLWLQPYAQQNMREMVQAARADLVTSLIYPGAFTFPAEGLTFYAQDMRAGEFYGLLISDNRQVNNAMDYIAETGVITILDNNPAISMKNGQIQQLDADGALAILNFESYTFDLSPYLDEESDILLKASDRYLSNLFSPDMRNYLERQDRFRYLAEGHARLAWPLINLCLALLALLAVTGGQAVRNGYRIQIIIAVFIALGIILCVLSIQVASVGQPILNNAQYGLPVGIFALIAYLHFNNVFISYKLKRRQAIQNQ